MRISSKNKKIFHGLSVLVLTVAVSAAVAKVDVKNFLYQTSILSYPEHAPFDGTVYPIAKSPDWSNLATDKWKVDFDQLSASELIDLPLYDPDQLATPAADLKWGNAADNVIRNAKITYSVPYLGNYQLDGKEFGGSHPGADLKVPMKTPVNAIANGVVIKSQNSSSGFGYNIVVMHNNFPSLDDASAQTVVYSSYSHLSELQADVGDVVKKGEQIGLSGDSGTATTPHVHFQIDNNDAPWHPFWPFTWKEASDAGLDFFSAVNQGLGQELAKKTTINPMKYVQKYLNAEGAVTSEENFAAEEEVNDDSVETASDSEEEVVVETDIVEEPVVVEDAEQLFTDVKRGSEYFGAVNYLANAEIIKGYSDGTFKPNTPVNRVEALKFILEAIHADLDEGAPPFKDTVDDEWYANYLFTAYTKKIVNGNPDGSFRPTDTVNKAEFFKILFNGMNVDINPTVENSPYADVATTDWFAPFMAYAKELGLTDQNENKIMPSSAMTRGEVAKAMYRLMKLKES